MKKEQGKLKKNMSQFDVWGLALGAIIGWGCFVLPGNAFLPKAGPLGAALGMIIGGLLITVIALNYGYLIIKFPQSGGEFIYTKETMGKGNAFICGWSMILAYWSLIPLNATAVALISRNLFPGIIQKGFMYEVAGWDVYLGEVIVASAFIIIMGFLNMRGIKQAAWTQTAIALTLVGGIFILFALTCFEGVEWSNLKPGFPNENNWWKSIFSIVAMAPWAYIGFDCIPQSAEEYNFSHQKSKRIMILSIVMAAILYIIINTITAVGYKPWQELLAEKHTWPTGFVVEHMLGHVGLVILGIAMFCAVISGMNAFYISTSRLMYAMAQDGALPKVFGNLNKKHGTPTNAIIFIMILSLLAPWFGREVLLWIVDMTSVGGAIVFAYTSASAAIIARTHGHTRQLINGIAGTIISLFFLSLLIIPGMPGFLAIESRYSLYVWIIIGIAFYMMRRKGYIKNSNNGR